MESLRIVLMYHSVAAGRDSLPSGREPGAGLYDVSLEDFRQQLWRIKNIRDGRLSLRERELFPDIDVVLTFDDGEMNNFVNAFPLLKEFGMTALFFITAQRIGKSGYLGPAELQVMSLAGMTLGSHGLTHRILTGLSDPELRDEMQESRKILESILSKPVTSFSVPRGFFDERVLRFARDAGYTEIFISDGVSPAPDVISRIAVKKAWTMERFDLALRKKTPFSERIQHVVKNILKQTLGPGGYDQLRRGWVKEQ